LTNLNMQLCCRRNESNPNREAPVEQRSFWSNLSPITSISASNLKMLGHNSNPLSINGTKISNFKSLEDDKLLNR